MKPILKWAGGKSRLAPLISDAFGTNCSGTYFEPFAGSAAVFLYRRARGQVRRAVLSDANAKLMAFHRAIRDNVDELILELEKLPRRNWQEHYYDVREAFNRGPWEGPAHAARFAWLNRAGFNGLYRENRAGKFNVPMGSYDELALPEPAHFWQVSQLLQGVELRDGRFQDVIGEASAGDQVYCDPPYVPLTATANFTAYCKEQFGPNEQLDLARMAIQAAAGGTRVVLSNHDVPWVRQELYLEDRGFEMVWSPLVSRAISRNGEGRKAVPEVIAAIGPVVRQAA